MLHVKLQLYKSNSSFNTINKDLTLLDTLDIHLKQNANLLNTQIIIHNNDKLKELNYAKMLDRSYFVQVQTLNNNKFLLLNLDEDVLETYKQQILASSQDVIEKSTAGNVKQTNVSPETVSKTFNSDLKIENDNESIIMVTSGQPIKNGENNQDDDRSN